MKDIDIIVIGGGPGGYSAAIKAAQKGKKVALIEKNALGGTCLNAGCIPTKLFLTSSSIYQKMKNSFFWGIHAENISYNFQKIVERKNQTILHLRNGLKHLIEANGIIIYSGEAKFISPHEIKITGEKENILSAKNIIIATGSEPIDLPNIFCNNNFIYNSASILNLEKLPKTLTIIGGGYIGCEFASFFASLGVEIKIIEAFPNLISSMGSTLSQALERAFKRKKIELYTSNTVEKIEKTEKGCFIILQNGKTITSDIVLIAIGRNSNTNTLALEQAGVKRDFFTNTIIVNDNMQTSVKHIFAVGDVTKKFMLAHVAVHQAFVAVENILGNNTTMNYRAIPSVIFTSPEIAKVGLSREEAKKENIEIIVKSLPFEALGKAHAIGEKEGFAQIIVDKKTKKIIGAEVFGNSSSELIAEMALAIENGLTLENIISTIHAHPTMAECWHEIALLANCSPLHIPPQKNLMPKE